MTRRLSEFVPYFREVFPDLCGGKVLVALSGGADSIALLHLLRLPGLDLSLEAVHVHHGLRGSDADADAEFCRRVCEACEIPIYLLQPGAEKGSGSLEADWRRIRYREFHQISEDSGAGTIATAHQSDDVAEGLLLQLLRGGGLRSLAGIHRRDGKLIRPLLPFGRQELRGWLNERAIPWVRDLTNNDPIHLRNRVRHEVLPHLEKMEPALRSHLLSLATQVSQVENWVAAELKQGPPFINPWLPGGVGVEDLAAMPALLQARWLQELCLREGIGACTRLQIESFRLLLDGETTSLNLPARWRLCRRGGLVYLEAPYPVEYCVPLHCGEEIPLPMRGWSVSLRPVSEPVAPSVWCCGIHSPESLMIRSPHRGDRLPGASKLSKKLKWILPRHLRWSWPILSKSDKILWIPGIAVEVDDRSPEWIVEVKSACQR